MQAALDEGVSATLHRFLSMARLLMSFHPQRSAAWYSLALGNHGPFREGWNEMRSATRDNPTYIFVSREAGRFSRERPPVNSTELNQIDEDQFPLLQQTPAWAAIVRFGDDVVQERGSPLSPSDAREILHSIESASAGPLGPDPSVDARIKQSLATIRSELDTDDLSLGIFAGQLSAAVSDYLGFRQTCTQAANTLAVLITRFAVRYPAPVGDRGDVAYVQEQIDHLVSLAGRLEDDRTKFDLGSYHRVSYFGLLCAETALVMCNGLSVNVSQALREWLAGRARYVDEFAAYYLRPTLVEPQRTCPATPQELLAASLEAHPRTYLPNPPDEVAGLWERIQMRSAAAVEHWQWNTDDGISLLCPSVRQKLSMFLLAYQLGRAM